MQRIEKQILKIIYAIIILFTIIRMTNSYVSNNMLKVVAITFELMIIIFELVYLMIQIFGEKKIVINMFVFSLVLLMGYEITISYKCGLMVMPDSIIDIMIWPLTILVFFNYARKNEIPEFIGKITRYAYIPFVIISYMLIGKHLAGFGNVGGVIFPVYFCLTFLPIVLYTTDNIKIKRTIIIITGLILVASTKRGGAIAYTIGLILYLFIDAHIQGTLKERWKRYFKYIVLGIICIIAIVIIIQTFDIPIVDRFLSLSDDGGSGRDAIWHFVMNDFNKSSDKVKIFGHGFQSVYYKLQPYGEYRLAHNSFIEYLYDYGYVGLSILILVLCYIIISAIKMIRKKYRGASVMVYTIAISAVFGYTSYFFEQSLIIVPIATLWGILIGEFKKYNAKNRKELK